MVSDIGYPPIPKMAARSFKSYLAYAGLMLAILGIIKNPNLTIFPILTGYIIFGLIRRMYRSTSMEKWKNKRRRKIVAS
jgi:phosphatidylserine synthase